MKHTMVAFLVVTGLACFPFYPSASAQDGGPKLVPRLIVIPNPGLCPDWESPESHALMIGSQSDQANLLTFGPQSLAVIEDALTVNLGGELSEDAIAELADFVGLELDSQSFFPRSASHAKTGGAEEQVVLMDPTTPGRTVAQTGAGGDVIVLGQFTIELINPSNSYWSECDDDPNNNYCGTWTIKQSRAPVQERQVCLAVGYFVR